MHSSIQHHETPQTFGDVRQLILETILNIRDGGLTIQQGMAIAANFKELNTNIMCEIAAAKVSMQTEDSAHSFGEVTHLGRRLISAHTSTN